MNTINDLSNVEAEVVKARARYIESDGAEWLLLSLALKTLSDAYSVHKMFDEANACLREYDSVKEKALGKMTSHLRVSDNSECLVDDSDEIRLWADKEYKSRQSLKEGGSAIDYAKTVFALCNSLWPPIQSDMCPIDKARLEWAKIKYCEALDALLSKPVEQSREKERIYYIIVISLKYSECEWALGNMAMAINYSRFPLRYIAQNANKESWDLSSINWDFVAKLCKAPAIM